MKVQNCYKTCTFMAALYKYDFMTFPTPISRSYKPCQSVNQPAYYLFIFLSQPTVKLKDKIKYK